MLTILAVSLALTLVFEVGFALLWGLRGRRELGLVALVNVLTNLPATLVLETAAVVVEWRCYRAFSRQIRRPLLFALLANGLSYGAGCVINML